MNKNSQTKLNKEVEEGNKRMGIVVSVWSILFAISTLILIFNNEDKLVRQLLVISWIVVAYVGIILSPKIIIKIWNK